MSPEENPSENLSQKPHGPTSADDLDNQPIEALLAVSASSPASEPEGHDPQSSDQALEPPVKSSFKSDAPPVANIENMAAKGGAIGALVLGVLTLAGSFITNFSLINGILGLMMGLWGLKSQKRRTAWVGMALCVIGILLCIVRVNDWMMEYLTTIDESDF